MKARFHIFSGTGNTMHAGRAISVILEKAGYGCELLEIDGQTAPPAGTVDLEIVMFPIYATAAPSLVRDYLRRFPAGAGTRAAVVSTNGRISSRWRDGYEGQALMQVRRMLQRRGYEVFLTDTLDYPHNITNIIPPLQQKNQAIIIDQAMGRLVKITDKIARGERSIRRCLWLNQIWCWIFGELYRWIGRRAMGKFFVADAKCTACGRCATHCPAQAIRIRGKQPRWNWNCQGCERCINLCPVKAIQTSGVRLLAVMAPLFFFRDFSTVLGSVPQLLDHNLGPAGGTAASMVLALVAGLVYVYMIDKLCFVVERIPGVGMIMKLSHTALFRRYLAPGFEARPCVKQGKKVANHKMMDVGKH